MSRVLVRVLALVALGSAASAIGLAGCNSVLGIERATLDDAGTASGDGGDPLTCENYCDVINQNCTGVNEEYLSKDVCLKLCSYLPKGRYYTPAEEPDNVDSLGCRLWHATVAPKEPGAHCRHAGPLGSVLCGGPCAPFCNLDWRFCTDDNGIALYEGQAAGCTSVCSDGGLPYLEGGSGDIKDLTDKEITAGNSLNCRLWHLETAIQKSMPTPHCLHTALVSDQCL